MKPDRILRVIAIPLLVGILAGPCLAQGICNIKTLRLGQIKGKVVYKVGDEPVANANLELRTYGGETLISAIETDSRGSFEIPKVRPGAYWLIAWKAPLLLRYAVKLKVVRTVSGTKQAGMILIRLGASPLEPCGGGDVTWLH